MSFWLGIFLTALMGVSLGLLGGGGSILAVPILVYVLGVEEHAAIAISLVLVGSTAWAAALQHHRAGLVDWKGGFLFAGCGAPVSLLGATLSKRLPGTLLMLLFGALMLVAGAAMYRRRMENYGEERKRNLLVLAACGASVVFLTGFLGVGGGFLIVPALVLFRREPMKSAIGTSLFVIGANCVVALWGHWEALHMNWKILLPLGGAALAGTFAGVAASHHFNAGQLRKAFAVFIVLLGAWMVLRNSAAFLPR
ncbi:MAG: sulfite exporter TauE/SafE family protein [Acidobacteria bacterium]|nr:sulfite exporter TauE/SafE family protein [Acidobacteriota bacterium]MBI3661894.1 sulfite exporter TauE/SafE family protein [Acidobacteriota bacterium]